MKKLLFLLLTALALTTSAQDKGLQASVYYNKAEAAYNNGSYDEAVSNLKLAENTLGQTNPKILYLLIQTLNQVTKTYPSRIPELKLALSKFFQIVDSKTYPAEKYLEITTIDIDLKDRERKMLEKEKMEEQFFEKVKASTDDYTLESFMSIYPNSKYMPQLRDRINALEQKKQQQKVVEQKKSEEKAKSVNPSGFYLNMGFALQTLNQLKNGPLAVSFLAKGVSFDIGNLHFGYKSVGRKFRVGFNITYINYTFAMSPKYNYYKYNIDNGYYDAKNDHAVMHTLQFMKMGPVFSIDLAKGQHYLYISPQIGGTFIAGTVPNLLGSHSTINKILSLGATPSIRIEYLYRKLFIGIRYQYNIAVDIKHQGLFGSNQIIVPSIGVKF